jgi:4-diphosphocytidyl-2-C-methyl-D-erythritol kinase
MCEKSYAKVNIFLKIVGLRGDYHELNSRFVRVKNLYDEVSFIKSNEKELKIIGNFSCPIEKNTVYKAYKLLEKYKRVEEFFKNYYVKIDKKIPEFAGLGGGSSNAATFINMVNRYCELNLNKDELAQIGKSVGADVPFFIYEYDSANVKGIGEIVEKFDEETLDIDVITPNIKCNTGEIFKLFRKDYFEEKSEYKELFSLKSDKILESLNIFEANDLYKVALKLEPKLEEFSKNYWFFSGSGSSFFRINSGKN